MAPRVVKNSMQTSVQKISNSQTGFSIIEIMVAIVLVALVFLAIPTGDTTYLHRKLTSAVDDIDRAVRFASNESTLRNAVVRIKFDLEKSPVTFTVEYGSRGQIVVPEIEEAKELSLEELESKKKEREQFDSQFNPIEEFKDLSRPFSPEVSFLGLASINSKEIITEGQVSLYFFPTGEKDESLIFLAAGTEIGTIELDAFGEEVYPRYHTFNLGKDEFDKLVNLRDNKMKEDYQQWLKP
jgi:prepilin-type N-terminal cleavage/methylation domain-containing protein